MPVYDQSYGHWDGEFRRTHFRWLPMVRFHVSQLLKKRMVWLMLFLSFIPAIGSSIPIYIAANQSGDSTIALTREIGLLLESAGILEEADSMGRGRESTNADVSLEEVYLLAAKYFLVFFVIQFQSLAVLIITSLVGAGLIAKDIRSNALEIYLTKPITAFDYLMGKLCVIGVFVFMVLFVPGLSLYIVASSLWPGFFDATYPVLLPFTLFCGLAAFVNGMVILGLSSLAKSSRYAAGIWFALCFVTGIVGNFLFMQTYSGTLALISYRESFGGIAEWLFETRSINELLLNPREQQLVRSAPIWMPFAILGGYVVASILILNKTLRNLENR
ncbi:MAG: ABC transporter permease subunit [Planctomycetes bacterium]|nr:ABC transporter permease subunit [Planctomycetota bacterium]